MQNFRITSDADRSDAAIAYRTDLYGTPYFCLMAMQSLDVHDGHFARYIDSLKNAAVIPDLGSDPSKAIASDATAVLAALAARSDHKSLATETRRILSMPFRTRFGTAIPVDDDGIAGGCDPDENHFGSQLAKRISEMLTANDTSEADDDKPFVTIGRSPDLQEIFGIISSADSSDVSLLFCSAPVFGSLAGIVRITRIDFDLVEKMSLTRSGIRGFAKLLRSDREFHRIIPSVSDVQ